MTMYEDGEALPVPEGFMEIRIEKGGEVLKTRVPEGSTIRVLINDGHLEGITTSSTRVNGAAATPDTSLKNGDNVYQVPTSGKQGQ